MKDVKWIEGAPERLEPGMLLKFWEGEVLLVGTDHVPALWDQAVAWAWLIKPHELEWVERMAKAHGAGK